MKSKEKMATVPRLRFPEFAEAGDWEKRKLCELTTKISDGIHTTPIYAHNGEYSFINGNNLVNGRIVIDEKTKRVNSVEFNKHKKPLDSNSLLMSINGTIGNFAFYRNEQVILGKSACFININEKLVNKFFIYNLLQTEEVKLFVNSKLTGSTIKNLSLTTIKNTDLLIPILHEQQKIADCLSSLDELIAATDKRLAAIQTHKKGLMQQLFPQAGATVPRLRFPEFAEAGDWEESTLNKLGELVSGLTYSPDDVRELGLLVLRSSNVQNGKITLNDNVYVTPSVKGANLSKANDILICVRNGSKALIGKNALIPEGMPLCTHGAFMTVFRPTQSAKFIFQLFQNNAYQKQVDADLGATINSINGSQFLKYKFFIPSLPEQQKIADCLSSLDELIAVTAQRLAALQTHKKGLMQAMFPAPATPTQPPP
jgi:type I restriction enzyme S subunit